MKNSIHSSEYRALVALLKSKREAASVTQTELATLLAEDQSWVSKVERCERRLDVSELRAICCAIGISLTSLIEEWEEIVNANPQSNQD